MQTEKKHINYPKKIARIFLKTILFLFLFIIFIFLLILTPPVQRFLTSKAENFLENKFKTKVEIGGIYFGLSGKVSLKDIYFEDQTKDTLLAGESIKAQVNIMKLFKNEVQVKDIELKNITAKIKRLLPDTVFNFQYMVDAFVTEQAKVPDTAQTAPMKMNISDVSLENINLVYNDVVTGNDMRMKIGNCSVTIDSLDLEKQHYNIPSVILRNTTARIRQTKPLVTAKEVAAIDTVNVAAPAPAMALNLDIVEFSNIDLDYANDVSAFYTVLDLGKLKLDARLIDLVNQRVHLDELSLTSTTSMIKLGKKAAAEQVEKAVKKTVEVEQQQGWDVVVDKIRIDNNVFQFDNDNTPALKHGLDFAHMRADSLTFHADNFIMNEDSIGTTVTAGRFKEKSGFRLSELSGQLLYSYNQAYLKDLLIRTPGTEIRRSAVLEYASFEALMAHPEKTIMDVEIVNSKVQVKDILAFAPQLRTHPAFSNPSAVWRLNIVGSGNMDRINFESLQFAGLRNTQLDANGTLSGLSNPANAGGNFTIHRFHTNQTDISLFTGQKLSASGITIPESVDLNGTISGNAGRLNTNLNISTSLGFAGITGSFSNLMDPAATTYNARVRATRLRIGTIIQNQQVGSFTGTMTVNGRGLTPETMRTSFTGYVNSFGFNNYAYSNVSMKGTLNKTVFDVDVNSMDPNAHMKASISGNMSANPSFRINGFIDSLKTLPLGFTTQPMVFRGKIVGDVPSVSPDHLEADVWITEGLLVANGSRLPLDTVHFESGRAGEGQFMRLASPIVNAAVEGQYRLADLGGIMINNIDPYFSISPETAMAVQPYDFTFRADLTYHPVFATLVPGFTAAQNIHAEGRIATNDGINGLITAPFISFNGNTISGLQTTIRTNDSGMVLNSDIAHLVSGTMDIYNVDLDAIALNNNINFNLGIDDKSGNSKYNLGGLVTQPSPGNLTIHLNPDSLLLNYEKWSSSPDNSISIINNQVLANNFLLQTGNQQIVMQSGTGANPPLNVTFNNFRIGTVSAFMQSDTLLVDGTTNGSISLQNIMTLPTFTGNLTITDLALRQDTIGNVAIQVASNGTRYNADATITGRGNDVQLEGWVQPQGKDMAMDLDLDIRRLDLKNMEGALKDFITSASGSINGNISIAGTSTAPDIEGKINFDSTNITTTVIGGPLKIDNESLNVTSEGFVFDNFSIRDSANNVLNLDGSVATSNFVNYNFDLDIKARNFRALNTTKKQNDIFYGELFMNTNLHIGGTEKTPVVDGGIVINEGTNFTIVIPQPEPGVAQREGIVEHVDFDAPKNDSLFLAYDSLNVTSIMGFDVAATIEIKKEAIFNIVVDEANGDFLNLRGEAVLSAGIDPSGKITLTGPFEIEEGAYRFSFNFLQRNFTIQKGSNIVWMGEPTNAQLDVTAVYEANIAPLDLVGAMEQDQRNFYLQKLPFQVLLNVDGELMKPALTFDITLPEDRNYNVAGDVENTVRNRLAQLRQEPSDMSKQVFAVLLLNRFVGENPFAGSEGGGFSAGSFARQSVSKLLTEQLNNLAADLVGGVDINFDVASTDDYTTGNRRNRTDLNVGISKQLLNDRLTVTVGSNFMLEGPQPSNQGSNNIAGNVSVNYQLTRDGRYMVRFYRKNEYEGMVDGYVVETGLGFRMSVDYNRFRQIFQQRRVRREQQKVNAENEAKQKEQEQQTEQKQNQQTNEPIKG
jgi:hypothetical protein